MAKKLFIKTYGCQMNVYDSARMADVLAPLGYAPADGPQGADLIILNTCHIREKAAEKVYSELGHLRRLKDDKAAAGGRMLIAVAGCVAQAEGEEILRRAPQVDLVFGPQTYHRLPRMLAAAQAAEAGAGVLDLDFLPWSPSSTSCPRRRPRAGRRACRRPSFRSRRAATGSAPSAWCPIRAAPNTRARWPTWWPRPNV